MTWPTARARPARPSHPRAALARWGPLPKRGEQRGKAADSGELLLADDDVSGDGKSTDGFHVTSRIN
jgi:hypothetical protein